MGGLDKQSEPASIGGNQVAKSCEHYVVSVTENAWSRYGTQTSYKYCMKCGRKAMDIGRHCKHKINDFGNCVWCLDRLTKYGCVHDWTQEPDTDEYWCLSCGEWADSFDEPVNDLASNNPEASAELSNPPKESL